MNCHNIFEAISRVASNMFRNGRWLVRAVRIAMCRFSFWYLDLIWANQSKAIEEPVPMLMSTGIRVF